MSFDCPEYTADADAMGTVRLLDAIKDTQVKTRFCQESSSELFGKVQEVPRRETTPFYPRSPYAAAKLYGFWIAEGTGVGKSFAQDRNFYLQKIRDPEFEIRSFAAVLGGFGNAAALFP